MPILPLPQFEADLEQDRKAYEQLKPPTSIVVRFGAMKMVGEFPYNGDAKPGCGTQLVVRTHRGMELGQMLTSTCPNAGCSKSVTRKEMLEYIENSGGRDYPFSTQGRILRVATVEDLNQQARIDARKHELLMGGRRRAAELKLKMKIVDAEEILGGDRITFYFASEDRVDFRELVSLLAADHRVRIDMRQVGARDEARLTADYERCGQHCCCKQFLKVLKPVSMRSAKTQKASLDPLKISGRCGRLMCCLRYEDQTYEDLRKRLPRKKSRVKTPDGWGIVVDTQILTQLVLVRLEKEDRDAAYPLEDLQLDGAGAAARAPATPTEPDVDDELGEDGAAEGHAPSDITAARPGSGQPGPEHRDRDRNRARPDGHRHVGAPNGGGGGDGGQPRPPAPPHAAGSQRPAPTQPEHGGPDEGALPGRPPRDQGSIADGPSQPSDGAGGPGGGERRRRRRRRRRRGGGAGGGGGSGSGGGGAGGGSGDGGPAEPPPPTGGPPR